jgi:hypothetical protein
MKKKRAYKGNSGPLSEDQDMHLVHGFTLDGAEPNFNHPRTSPMFDCPFKDADHIRRAWIENRERLLAGCDPFKRPWGWWRYDAPEPRRATPAVFAYGPQGWTYYPPETTGLYDPKQAEVEETERDYLIRHPELLTPAEKVLLVE